MCRCWWCLQDLAVIQDLRVNRENEVHLAQMDAPVQQASQDSRVTEARTASKVRPVIPVLRDDREVLDLEVTEVRMEPLEIPDHRE